MADEFKARMCVVFLFLRVGNIGSRVVGRTREHAKIFCDGPWLARSFGARTIISWLGIRVRWLQRF